MIMKGNKENDKTVILKESTSIKLILDDIKGIFGWNLRWNKNHEFTYQGPVVGKIEWH